MEFSIPKGQIFQSDKQIIFLFLYGQAKKKKKKNVFFFCLH